jgi:hypothetical protein
MDSKAFAQSLSEQISEFGNVRFTDHFVKRLFERKVDFNTGSIHKFIALNRNQLCELIYESVKNGLEIRTRRITIDGVRYCYGIDQPREDAAPRVVWTTVYWRE